MDTESNKAGQNIEEALFRTLSHQKRRDILRVIGEKKEAGFTEIKNAIGTEDSSSLSYHLNALDYLVVQQKGKYRLSELGQDTYNLICKATTNTRSDLTIRMIRKDLAAAIVANAILWAAAIFAVSQFQGTLEKMTLISFAALWFVSNIILYSILTRIRKA